MNEPAPVLRSFDLTAEEVALVSSALAHFYEALSLKIGRLQAIRNGVPIKSGDACVSRRGEAARGIDIGEEDLLAVIYLNQAVARGLKPLIERFGAAL